MIQLATEDFVPLAHFGRARRFADPAFNVLPPETLADLRPLTPSRAAALHPSLTRACATLHLGVSEASISFRADGTDEGSDARTRGDLAALPIDDGERVIVSWDATDAAETSWKTFRTYWDDFCYPSSDDVTISPLDERWLLCYHHEGRFAFDSVVGR